MKKLIVNYKFLDEQFYSSLKKEIRSINLGSLSGGRSSLDLREGDIRSNYLLFFNQNYTNNVKWWEMCSKMLKLDIELQPFEAGFVEPPNGLFKTQDKFFYGRMDVGFGLEGYGLVNGGKGNHIDNFNRVISCLLYFSDQSEVDGGEFEITNAEGETLEKLSIRENMCIMSVQDKDGWHRVNPVTKIKGFPRTAIYFALSYSQKYFDR